MLRDKAFRSVYLIQVVYAFAVMFSWSFALFYLVGRGFSYTDLILMKVFVYLAAVPLMFFMRKVDSMKAMAAGLIGFAFLISSLIVVWDTPSLIAIALLDGFTYPLFWVAFNTVYFGFADKVGTAFLSGIGFLVFPLLGVFTPLLSGVIIDSAGAEVVFLLGSLLLLIASYSVVKRKGATLSYNVKRALSSCKGVKSLLFIEGFWQGVDWIAVPLFTLYFLSSGTSYGGFLSYVAVFGALSTLFLCRRSDKSGNRVNYLYPAVFLTASATIVSSSVSTLLNWFLVRAIIGFFVAVANPFTTSVVLDRVKGVGDAMHVRELLFSAGRLAGSFTVLTCHLFLGGFQKAFIVSGLLLLAYPAVVEYKKLYPRKLSGKAFASEESLEFTD